MANPLYNLLGGGSAPATHLANMLQRFNQFRSTFSGDPKQVVQNLLNSGQMSQQQFNQLQQMASQFQKMMK